MKVYKTHVFSIGYNENLGKDKYIGEMLVKKTLLGIEEIKTGWPIRMVSIDSINKKHPNSYMREQVYKEFGYDLVAIKEDIHEENMVKSELLEKYMEEFNDTKVGKLFSKMNLLPIDETSNKVKELKK